MRPVFYGYTVLADKGVHTLMCKSIGRLSVVAFCFTASSVLSLAQSQTARPAQIRAFNQILDTHRLLDLEDRTLVTVLDSIKAAASVTAIDDAYWTFAKSDGSSVLVVPLRDSTTPDRILYLYYLPNTQQHFLLQLMRNPDRGDAIELRMWSTAAASEILATEEGLVVLRQPSKYTFRILPSSASKGGVRDALSPGDIILCLAKTLGIDVASLITTNWTQLIGALTCSATSTFATYQTVLLCLSTLGVGANLVTATTGCVAGIAQLISCGFVNCSTAAADFTLSATPSSQNITQGQTAVYTITENVSGGFTAPISGFTVSNLPPGASSSFSAQSITTPADATQLSITTNSSTTVGNRQMTITASGGGLTKSTGVELNINPPASGSGGNVNRAIVSKTNPGGVCSDPPSDRVFLTTDNTVYLYFYAVTAASDQITSNWLAPEGTVISGPSWSNNSGTYCYPGASLSISNLPSRQLGSWTARVYENGSLQTSIPFTVSAPGGGSGGLTIPHIDDINPKNVPVGIETTFTLDGSGFQNGLIGKLLVGNNSWWVFT